MTGIRILADDLTGALDTAAAFSGKVPVYIDHPPLVSESDGDQPVSVVATPTRDVAVEELAGFLEPVLDWFVSGRMSFKKVDSLLRGNTFEEIAWLCRRGGFERVLFAPAFPAQADNVGGPSMACSSGTGSGSGSRSFGGRVCAVRVADRAALDDRADVWFPRSRRMAIWTGPSCRLRQPKNT